MWLPTAFLSKADRRKVEAMEERPDDQRRRHCRRFASEGSATSLLNAEVMRCVARSLWVGIELRARAVMQAEVTVQD
jgi:hypothetical protein